MSTTGDRDLTAAEEQWCKAMARLMRKKPKSLTLFANGAIHVLDTGEFHNRQPGAGVPQPIYGTTLGPCEGGDF